MGVQGFNEVLKPTYDGIVEPPVLLCRFFVGVVASTKRLAVVVLREHFLVVI